MPRKRKTLDQDGLYRRTDSPYWWASYVDASGSDAALVDLYETRILPAARSAFEAAGQRERETHHVPFLLGALCCVLVVLATTDRRRA